MTARPDEESDERRPSVFSEGWRPRPVQRYGRVGWILWWSLFLIMTGLFVAVIVLSVDAVMAVLRWLVAHL